MGHPDDRNGRRTRTFWHRFPKDNGWKKCTLAYADERGFRLEPCCRNCWHRGRNMTGAEIAVWADVPLDTPIIALAARLICSVCSYPAGYLHMHNPAGRSFSGYPKI